MNNHFSIVIPSYNNEQWVEYNVASILNQTYTNYDVLYIDDASTDKTYEMVKSIVGDLPNWKIVKNEKNMKRGYNVSPYNPHIKSLIKGDDDILVFVDGDDWLFNENALDIVDQFYTNSRVWMTYGTFVCYPSEGIGHPQNTAYHPDVHAKKMYRKDLWRASHLRTFKWFLYNRVREQDMIYTKTGQYYFHAEDLATSFPCLEMCPPEKIGVIPDVVYVFNETPSNRARGEEREKQAGMDLEIEIRNRPPYETLSFGKKMISCKMAGGLANMMFEAATTLAIGLDYDRDVALDLSPYIVPHKPPETYANNVFRKFNKLTATTMNGSAGWVRCDEKTFEYNRMVIPENQHVMLVGGFQSEKHFVHRSKEVREMFSMPEEVAKIIKDKYQFIVDGHYVSMHVRRGDYTKLSEYHHNLSVNYYRNALDYFEGMKVAVFSDDIPYCKEQFKGDRFYFVEGENEVTDIYLMSVCEHNIICNSSFSWWGAWLNNNRNKVVVYPDKWFGPKNSSILTKDLIPDQWVCLAEEEPKMVVNYFDLNCGHLAKPNGRYSIINTKISKHLKFIRDDINFDGVSIFTDDSMFKDVVDRSTSLTRIGFLLEPKEVSPRTYANIESVMNKFHIILTHDDELLAKHPSKFKFAPAGGCWIHEKNMAIQPKTKNVSMVMSNKTQLEGHKLRHIIANTTQGIDLYGNGTPNPIKYKEEALSDYRFSLAIENSRQKNYFTEKIIDCFVLGTVPVYWGCPNLGDFFDPEGVIVFKSFEEFQAVAPQLNGDTYYRMLSCGALQRNLELAKNYSVVEDWIYENILK